MQADKDGDRKYFDDETGLDVQYEDEDEQIQIIDDEGDDDFDLQLEGLDDDEQIQIIDDQGDDDFDLQFEGIEDDPQIQIIDDQQFDFEDDEYISQFEDDDEQFQIIDDEDDDYIYQSDEDDDYEDRKKEKQLDKIDKQLQMANKKIKALQQSNRKYRRTLSRTMKQFDESTLLLMKERYINKLFESYSLSRNQKELIIDRFDNDRINDIQKTKKLYSRIVREFEQKKGGMIKERPSSRVMKSHRTRTPLTEETNLKNRFQKLANIQQSKDENKRNRFEQLSS